MRRFWANYGISIRHLFTEARHGKSACDGIEGHVKTQLDISVLKSHLLIYLNSFQCYVVILVFAPSFVLLWIKEYFF